MSTSRSTKLRDNLLNLTHEYSLWRRGYKRIAGVDEVGRGAWSGPIVAGAVSITLREFNKLSHQPWFVLVRDSKKLSPKMRMMIAGEFKKISHSWSVAQVSSHNIDEFGIGEANRGVVMMAVCGLKPLTNYVVADYVAKLPNKLNNITIETIINADAKIFCVALASIIAKVYRDELMKKLAKHYPNYGFEKNMGYGTEFHKVALRRFGPCAEHRRSYRPVANALL